MGGARRAAEKAARQRLAGPLINAAGELGVAVAAQLAASDGVAAAEERGRKHVQQGPARGGADGVGRPDAGDLGDDGYRQAHEDAVQAGWSPAALAEMGHPAPAAARRNRVQPVRAEQTAPSAAAEQTDANSAAERVA